MFFLIGVCYETFAEVSLCGYTVRVVKSNISTSQTSFPSLITYLMSIYHSKMSSGRLFFRAVLRREFKETYELGIPKLGLGLELGLGIRSRVRDRVAQT